MLSRRSSEAIDIVPCHPSKLDGAWLSVQPWLAAAMKEPPTLYSERDVFESCERKDMILWLAMTSSEVVGMAITEVISFPRGVVCEIKWSGGKDARRGEWLPLILKTIEGYARHFSINWLGGYDHNGRLRELGFEDGGAVVRKHITQ